VAWGPAVHAIETRLPQYSSPPSSPLVESAEPDRLNKSQPRKHTGQAVSTPRVPENDIRGLSPGDLGAHSKASHTTWKNPVIEVESPSGLLITQLMHPIDAIYSLVSVLHKDTITLVYLTTPVHTLQQRVIKRVNKKHRFANIHNHGNEERFRSEAA